MSQKIKIVYACTDLPSRSFLIMVDAATTCQDFLRIINIKQKKHYISLFFDRSQLNNNDLIKDFWDTDHETIFYASLTNDPPKSELIRSVNESKNPKPQQKSDKPKKVQQAPPPRKIDPDLLTPHPNICADINPYSFIVSTGPEEQREEIKGKFIFYYTGGSKNHLLKGIPIDLEVKMNPTQCCNKLKEVLSSNHVMIGKKELLVYLPGGIPFLNGHLSDIYSSSQIKAQKVIYAVLTRQISDSILNKKYFELCDASDEEHKLIISPFCDSSNRGLSDIACLLGLLNRNETLSDTILRCFALVIHFPPFLTSLQKIADNNNILGRDIVTFCSTFFSYMRIYLPESISDVQLFEHCLNFCSLICFLDKKAPNSLPISLVDVNKNKSETKFLSDLKLGPSVYLWRADFNEKFFFRDLSMSYTLENINEIKKRFSISSLVYQNQPLSACNFFENFIIHGKDQEYLYMNPSLNKAYKYQNMVDIIDPLTCKTETKDIETFAKEQSNENDVSSVVNPDLVESIIMFNLDESKTMFEDMEDNHIAPFSDDANRMTVAIQIITDFVNRSYGYHIPCIQGLVSFNDKITLKCPLTPFISDFEEKGFKNIQMNSKPKLWDSISFSCDKIIEFRTSRKGFDLYKNAQSRILVISNDEDCDSENKVEDVVKKLIKHKIIVDCIILNKEVDNKMLCAVCHITGGLAFRPNDVEEALSFIEQESFVNFSTRKHSINPIIPGNRFTICSRIKPEHITEEFMNKAKENSNFDSEVKNVIIISHTNNNIRLATSFHSATRYFCEDKNRPNRVFIRILKEVRIVAQATDPNNEFYDPDIKVFTFHANIDRWKVFLKGPTGTPYENKWWFLLVFFPDGYPTKPPNIRFISVPNHINVSKDGKICIDSLEKCYIPSKHVLEIIQEIKEILILPCFDRPIRIDLYWIFINEREKYNELVLDSTKNSDSIKDDYNKYIENTLIATEVPSDYKFSEKVDDKPFLISQISGKRINKENLMLASSGAYYDKNELARYIKSNKNPVCVITGKFVTEKFDDLAKSDKI